MAGGLNPDTAMGDLATAELYDPATGKWSPTGSMLTSLSDFTATLLEDGRVLVVAGGSSDTSAELYEPAAAKFIPTGHMLVPFGMETATLLSDGRVLIVGVGNNAPLAELYWP